MTQRETRYSIMESCMRPSGAYAKTQVSYTDEDTARVAFARAYFQGPGYGILWAKSLTLRASTWQEGMYQSEVLKERTVQ